MHEWNQRPVADRPESNAYLPGAGALANQPRDNRPRDRRLSRISAAVLTVTTVAAVIVALALRPSSARPDLAPHEGAWSVDLNSAGLSPVTALVFGKEAGVHLVTVPAADGSAEPRRLPTRLSAGDIYMVSLGWNDLSVTSASPKGSARMAFGAQGRFVKLFKDRRATGIATGIRTWW